VKNRTKSLIAFLLLVVLIVGAAIVLKEFQFVGALADATDMDFRRLFTQPFFAVGNLEVTPALLLKGIMFFLILLYLAHRVRKFLSQDVLPRTSLDMGQQDALARLTSYSIVLLGLTIGLQTIGVNLSSLLVVGGAVGIGVGFGLQTIASNFVSGLILLVERPIKLGDRVEVGTTNGDVVRMAARSTWVRTNDNVVIIVPNSEFVSNRITNWTANDRQVRFSMPIGVSYGSNPDEVREVLLKAALAHPDVLPHPGPEVRFVGFGDSSLDFELRIWTIRQVQTPKMLTSDLYFAVFRAFREHKIEIPFPQRDLHLKSVAAPVRIAGSTTG
jgi:small-conductance mechanosensitive channel